MGTNNQERKELLKKYLYPNFKDEEGNYPLEEHTIIELFAESLDFHEIIHTSNVISQLLEQFTRRYIEADEKNRKNLKRTYSNFNSKLQDHFEELINCGEVYKAAMIFYTQRNKLPKTKHEVLSTFDELLEDKLIIRCSNNTWTKIKSILHKVIKRNLVYIKHVKKTNPKDMTDKFEPYMAVKYMFDEKKREIELKKIEEISDAIFNLIQVKTIKYKGESSFTEFDINELWEHHELRKLLP